MSAWAKFDDGEFVVMETGVLGFSKDIGAVLHKSESSGGFSAGGTRAWEMFLYKTYSKELIYSMDPFDSRDDHYSGILLGRRGSFPSSSDAHHIDVHESIGKGDGCP